MSNTPTPIDIADLILGEAAQMTRIAAEMTEEALTMSQLWRRNEARVGLMTAEKARGLLGYLSNLQRATDDAKGVLEIISAEVQRAGVLPDLKA